MSEHEGWNNIGLVLVQSDVVPSDGIVAPLRIVLSYNKEKKEFAVHTQNMQNEGLFNGFYTKSLRQAVCRYEDTYAHNTGAKNHLWDTTLWSEVVPYLKDHARWDDER